MLLVPDRMSGLHAEIVGPSALPDLTAHWKGLSDRAVEDNVYYAPKYADALLRNLDRHGRWQLALVWRGATLAGLLPFVTRKIAAPLIEPAARAWTTKYTFNCTPLLDRDCAVDAAAALLGLLEWVAPGEWSIPNLNIDGAACRALTQALDRKGHPWKVANRFQRATLGLDLGFEDHMHARVGHSRRKELARRRRRLEERGVVAHETHCFGAGLRRAVNAFLDIEARGWKGRRGTALACNAATRQFALEAFTGDRQDSICRADVLTLDGTAIAVSLTALAGRTGFTVKCTYDEAYRSCAAGLLLEIEVIRSFLSDRWADRLDAATAGPHVLDDLWLGHIAVGDLFFSLAPTYPEQRLLVFHRAQELRQTYRQAIKSTLERTARVWGRN